METRPKKTTANHEIDGRGVDKISFNHWIPAAFGFPLLYNRQPPDIRVRVDNSAVCTTSNNDAKLHRIKTRLITAPNPISIGFNAHNNKNPKKMQKNSKNAVYCSIHALNPYSLLFDDLSNTQYEFY